MVTHELETIFGIVDRCLLLDKQKKRVAAVGDPRTLRDSSDPNVHDFFNPTSKRKERSWRPPPIT